MSDLTSTVSAFDDARELFATVGIDNRLAVYSSSTGELKSEFVEESQYAQVYTAIAWGVSTKSGKKTSAIQAKQSALAIGTATGGIIVWDLHLGEVTHNLEEHGSQVSSLVFSKNGEFLYSCSKDQYVIQWSLLTGSVVHKFRKDTKPLTQLALSPDESVLGVAGTMIKLYDLSSKTVVKKYGGHLNSVTSLHFSKDGRYLVSSANDRYQYLWDAKIEGENLGNTKAIESFVSESASNHVEFFQKKNGAFNILASSSTSVSVWEFVEETEGKKKPIPPNSVIKSNTKDLKAVAFSSSNSIVAARIQSDAKFFFSKVEFSSKEDPNSYEKNLQFPEVSTHSSSSSTGASQQKVVNIGATDVKPQNAQFSNSSASKEVKENEETMAQKLERIQSEKKAKNEEALEKKEAPSTDSLHSLLSQALKKNDHDRVSQVLNVTQEQIIQNTVSRLGTQSVIPLVQALTFRYQKRPGNSHYIFWMRSVLTHHASYLMTAPGDELQNLYSILNQRVTLFKKLCKLNGKLDLLLSQTGKFKAAPFAEGSYYVENEDEEDDDDEEENEDEEGEEGEEDEEEEEENKEEGDEMDEDESESEEEEDDMEV